MTTATLRHPGITGRNRTYPAWAVAVAARYAPHVAMRGASGEEVLEHFGLRTEAQFRDLQRELEVVEAAGRPRSTDAGGSADAVLADIARGYDMSPDQFLQTFWNGDRTKWAAAFALTRQVSESGATMPPDETERQLARSFGYERVEDYRASMKRREN